MIETEWLTAALEEMRRLPYGGERVDQRAHALQCAQLARDAGAPDELILGAALHDIARAPSVGLRFRGLPHEEAGARFVGPLLGPRVAGLVHAHVIAKRYLATVEPAHVLSDASQRSLVRQGGPLAPSEAAAFAEHPLFADAIALRRFDDAAKSPGAPEFALPELLEVYERHVRRAW